jgi:hypothetical protein
LPQRFVWRVGTILLALSPPPQVHFYKPQTLILARKPKYARKSVVPQTKMHKYRVIKGPLTSEAAMKKIEDHNTLVFLVDKRANKRQIKEAVKSIYEIQCAKVNTLIRCVVWLAWERLAARRGGGYACVSVCPGVGLLTGSVALWSPGVVCVCVCVRARVLGAVGTHACSPDGQKKAYVRLTPDHDALDIANRIGTWRWVCPGVAGAHRFPARARVPARVLRPVLLLLLLLLLSVYVQASSKEPCGFPATDASTVLWC